MRTSSLLLLGFGLSNVCSALPSLMSKLRPETRAAAANASCATGVYMIVARGSTEAAGEGITGTVATSVQQAVPGSSSVGVDYPATLTDYLASEASGVAAMTSMIQSYVASCPDSKIALLGFSQVK